MTSVDGLLLTAIVDVDGDATAPSYRPLCDPDPAAAAAFDDDDDVAPQLLDSAPRVIGDEKEERQQGLSSTHRLPAGRSSTAFGRRSISFGPCEQIG